MSAPDTTFLRVFALYPLIAVGIIAIFVICWDGICDFFSSLWDEFVYIPAQHRRDKANNCYDQPALKHHSRRKWRLFLPFLSYRRRKWIEKSKGRRANRKCKDIIAESLATQEDILEAMYDESPSIWQVYRNVKDR